MMRDQPDDLGLDELRALAAVARKNYIDALEAAHRRRDAPDMWTSKRGARARWNDLPPTTAPVQPNYWDPSLGNLNSAEQIVLPGNWNRGSGRVAAPEEIEAATARQPEFARKLAEQWKWRLFHL